MNWKALLPAAALLVLFAPSAAFSRNHHDNGYGSQNGMMGQYGNSGQYYSGANHGISPLANSGINPYAAAPIATVAQYGGGNAFANNGFGYAGNNGYGNNGFGNNAFANLNGMNNMCQRRHHKHRRRGMLQSLLGGNSYGYGNSGYGNMGGYGQGFGNSYGGYGGYGGGLTNGLRNVLNRF